MIRSAVALIGGFVLLSSARAQSDPCHAKYTTEAACNADNSTGGGCVWCKCAAVPSSCWTVKNSKSLPPGVYQCDKKTERDAIIAHVNSVQKEWSAAHNDRFRDTPLGSSKSLCGVKPWPPAQPLSENNGVVVFEHSGVSIPDSFDSAANWPQCKEVITDIRDQSNCGCCWAFGAASAASDRLCIASNGTVQVPLSAQDLCFCASDDGCDGGDLFTPWSYIQSTGLVTGGQYQGSGPFGAGYCSDFSLPHCHHHGPQGKDPYPAEGKPGCPSQSSPSCPRSCDSSAKAPHNQFSNDRYTFSGLVTSYASAESIQEAIMKFGPVETAFSVYADFENYASGIYHHVSGEMLGGHAVRIVGWGSENGVKYWKVANSWNPYWGEEGYFRIRRGQDECGIESQATSSSGDSKWSLMK